MIVPAPRANGRAVTEVLVRWQGRLGGIDTDDAYAADVAAAAGEAPVDLDNDPWRD
jgi:hypothetical protein